MPCLPGALVGHFGEISAKHSQFDVLVYRVLLAQFTALVILLFEKLSDTAILCFQSVVGIRTIARLGKVEGEAKARRKDYDEENRGLRITKRRGT